MIELIFEIRDLVRRAARRSKSGRCSFTPEQKTKILWFADEVLRQGFAVHDAAEILSIHPSTLRGWIELREECCPCSGESRVLL